MPARPKSMTVLEDTSMDRLMAAQLSKLLVLAPPWAILVLTALTAVLFHGLWPQPWAAAGVGVLGAALAVLTWIVSHQRGRFGRWHAGASVLGAGTWLAAADAEGPGWLPLAYLAVVGGAALALSWNIRAVIRHHRGDDGDHLVRAFAGAAENAGMKGTTLHVTGRKAKVIEGKILLNPGDTADDAIKKAPRLESALRFPPGSLQIAPDMDRADHALTRITDPRAIRKPQPWPGPSHPGKSIALPARPGVYQDSEPVSYIMAGHHLQIMGMTGSGKSVGVAYSLLGEVITRSDVAVIGIDITKGDQTLGPFRPALHLLETDKARAKALLARIQAVIKPRTDYLAAKGLSNWQPGCGLTYLIVWLEEAPDILDALGDKGLQQFLSALKAARSAGVEFVISLQRADWSQMPTLARGQLAKLCMGVDSSDDAKFGLSELQEERNCRPELWSNKQPGMAYLDAPSIPDDRVAMPWRAYYWGADDKKAREHAAKYPASRRPLDALTAAAIGGEGAPPDEPDEDDDPVREYATEEDEAVDSDGNTIEVPDPGSEFGGWQFSGEPGKKMDPVQARELFASTLATWAGEGRESFTMADLVGLRERTGMSRPWVYKQLDAAADDGLIERDEEVAGRWLFRRP